MMVNLLAVFGIPDWLWDSISLLVTLVLLLAVIRLTIQLQKRETLSPSVARNMFRIIGGPLFLVCWLLYSGVFFSRYMAAVIPALLIFYSIMIALFDWQDEGFVNVMAYEGDKYNLLTGPLLYLLVMVFAVFYLWYVPLNLNGTPQFTLFIPTAILIFGPLAGGSGIANIINDKYSKRSFTVLGKKSLEGSLAMLCFSIVSTFGILGIYWLILEPTFGSINLGALILPIILVSIIATIIEMASPRDVDIVLIPLAVLITVFILSTLGFFPYFVVFPFRPPF